MVWWDWDHLFKLAWLNRARVNLAGFLAIVAVRFDAVDVRRLAFIAAVRLDAIGVGRLWSSPEARGVMAAAGQKLQTSAVPRKK